MNTTTVKKEPKLHITSLRRNDWFINNIASQREHTFFTVCNISAVLNADGPSCYTLRRPIDGVKAIQQQGGVTEST